MSRYELFFLFVFQVPLAIIHSSKLKVADLSGRDLFVHPESRPYSLPHRWGNNSDVVHGAHLLALHGFHSMRQEARVRFLAFEYQNGEAIFFSHRFVLQVSITVIHSANVQLQTIADLSDRTSLYTKKLAPSYMYITRA
jgi:hypothetical protein